MTTYSAWLQNKSGPFSQLEFSEIELPVPQDGEVLIETKASTLNYADLLLSSGMYQSKPDYPFVPGFEVAGIVKSVPKSSKLKEGDRVVGATTVFRNGRYGSFGDFCISSENLTYPLPTNISYEAGAAILMSYLTSDFALHRRAQLKKGELVLVNAAAGGVGISAVQLAKLAGARVIAAVGSKDKIKIIKKYNPDLVINYQTQNLKEEIEKKYGKSPLNIFYDQVGGRHYEEGIKLLSSEGRALIVGFASGNIPTQILSYLLVKNISLMGVFMISFENNDKEYLRERMNLIFELYLSNKIDPVYKTIAFQDILTYLDLIGSRKTVGRIVAVR